MQSLRVVATPLAARALVLQPRVSAVGVRHITYGENDQINPKFSNRNPRNMEMLRLARKPQGWGLEACRPRYWYKLTLDQSNRHYTGTVKHHTGCTVVSASTREWAIKQQLYSTTNVNAVYNIGRVLARRCLESGITEVTLKLKQQAEESTKLEMFLSALRDGGLELKEPGFIHEGKINRFGVKREILPWHIQEEDVVSSDPPSANTSTQ